MQGPIYTIEGTTIVITRDYGRVERCECETIQEAKARVRFIQECLSWVGTPFVDCGSVKGPNGAVDCVMMMARASIDSGLHEEFDPRPYSPRHMLFSKDQLFVKYLTEKLGCVEVEVPKVGDIVAYWFGQCYSHGAVLIDSDEVVHASGGHGICTISPRNEPLLNFFNLKSVKNVERPIAYFNYSRTWKV
jgi:hypothetical protein